ncbi:hypothetical protein ABZX12_40855 [Kribbella sp. NPDC003505]|uniref:hypothetical protein n=1 Tax=Kribbella sp. NPDC003505 TaxID=3154448 RepID=UPI0033A5E932
MQYSVYRKNDLNYPQVKYVGALGAASLLTGYPKWFFTAATDFPAVVDAGDARLATPPGKVAAVLARRCDRGKQEPVRQTVHAG